MTGAFAHKLPPLSEKEIAAREFRKSASLADLHERLGRLLSVGPTITTGNGSRVNKVDHSPLRDVPQIATPIATETPGMRAIIDKARADMGEERWAELSEAMK